MTCYDGLSSKLTSQPRAMIKNQQTFLLFFMYNYWPSFLQPILFFFSFWNASCFLRLVKQGSIGTLGKLRQMGFTPDLINPIESEQGEQEFNQSRRDKTENTDPMIAMGRLDQLTLS